MVAKGIGTSARGRKNQKEAGPLTINAGRSYLTFHISISRLLPAIILACVSCAEIGAPPGGPIDRSGPFILESIPSDGSTNVSVSDRVTILFSETVVEPSSGRSIFISPRPSSEPRLKWKSDRLTVIFADSFKVNQTYVLSINNTVTDLRNNPLDSNSSIAFSTGSFLDSGRVSGIVEDNDEPAVGVQVALYDMAVISDTTNFDSLFPEYLAAGNREGRFFFQNIPEKEYLLAAFVDRDRNERPALYRELTGVADRKVIVGGTLNTDNLHIPLSSLDSSTVRITTVRQTADNLLRVNLSRSIKTAYLSRTPSGARLSRIDTSGLALRAAAIVETDRYASDIVTLYFPELMPGIYRLEIDWSATDTVLAFDSVRVERRQDTNPPRIVRFKPAPSPAFLDESRISLRFSEPVDTQKASDQSFTLFTDDSIVVPVTPVWENPFDISFQTASLKEGGAFRLIVTEFDIIDLSGNALGDSLSEFAFRIFDTDSLGTISGEISVMPDHRKNDPAVLSFRKLDNNRVFDLPVGGKTFSISVPAGKYFLSGFLDSDDDGRRGLGSLKPFVLSETVSTYTDTIRVRARFETSGIRMEFE